MIDQRWQQISALYHDVLARDPGERRAYLREACKGDEVLQQEVASLLAHDAGEAFVDTPALAAAAQALAAAPAASLVGRRLGPYQVVAFLGAGGMGEVYRARDSRLGRDVALKMLPERFIADADRLARFVREAQLLASLNHPNIATIYGIEDAGGRQALVLELIDGETLAQRIARGVIPLDEALHLSRQIASGLEAAHESGVIHRDLKPANIKVRPDGTVKILDFGLAKALDPAHAAPAGEPTMTAPATHMGVVLGTAAYMSPEQARGQSADRRSDIWAFGAVLFEILGGKRAFQGDSVADAMAAVMTSEPRWPDLPTDTPTSVRTC